MAFQRECSGRAPGSVTVRLGEETLVVTLDGALSPAEKAMAQTPEGSARVHEFYRQLFHTSAARLHEQIGRKILGVAGQGNRPFKMEPVKGRIVEVFPSGALVQVFRLAQPVAIEAWSTPKSRIRLPASWLLQRAK